VCWSAGLVVGEEPFPKVDRVLSSDSNNVTLRKDDYEERSILYKAQEIRYAIAKGTRIEKKSLEHREGILAKAYVWRQRRVRHVPGRAVAEYKTIAPNKLRTRPL
jgi:hypothetical protein